MSWSIKNSQEIDFFFQEFEFWGTKSPNNFSWLFLFLEHSIYNEKLQVPKMLVEFILPKEMKKLLKSVWGKSWKLFTNFDNLNEKYFHYVLFKSAQHFLEIKPRNFSLNFQIQFKFVNASKKTFFQDQLDSW